MHVAFQPLLARVRPLGNPARKFLRTIERHGDLLLVRLEAAGILSHIHLDRSAPAVAEDFERVAAASRTSEERLFLLGSFYAVQLLHLNARALERLAVDLAEKSDRLGSYEAFLDRIEEEFFSLVSTYAKHVLRTVTPPGAGAFVLLHVGSPGHQDDIDAAVVVGEAEQRAEVDRAIARLSGECLRYASPLDNYVAEEAGSEGFCVTLEELRDALRSGRLGFVVLTELLRAEPLAGKTELLERLRHDILDEYFFRAGRDNSRHELYLRGILGETRALLLVPPPRNQVNPKDDALRLILGLATAYRTIADVPATQPGAIFGKLISRRPELHAPLVRLQQSRVFLETFRQICQLLVAQEEEIAVDGETARADLELVAAAMGYRSWGPIEAADHLLVHYHEAVKAAHEAAMVLMDGVARHLNTISRFSPWTRGSPPEDIATGLAQALAEATRAFRGVRFYDDLLEAFAAPGGARLEAFIRGFARLAPQKRQELAKLYAEWGRDAPYALLTLMTLLAPHVSRDCSVDPVDEIAESFLSRLGEKPEAVRALSRVFRSYPELMNRFLFALRTSRLEQLEANIDVPIGNPEVAEAREAFHALIRVHRQSSRYIKRVLARVTGRHPATVGAVSDDALLRTLAHGRLAAGERHPSSETQKGLLGDFYDIEFLRIAMGTLRGEREETTQTAFAELTTTYLNRLFDFCFRQVEQETGGWTADRDRVGFFLSGGNARGRPYDEDYDLLVLLDSLDPPNRLFTERVIVLMNEQIARRGVMPQYRLGDRLGRFGTTLEELVDLLRMEADDLFVDCCQLVGSRMIVGSRRIEEQVLQQVIRPLVFQTAEAFATRVAREIRERRADFASPIAGTLNLKENPGGLREIDLALATAKTRLGLWKVAGTDPFSELIRLDPERTDIYRTFASTNLLLVSVRSAYRVAVAATDEIEREYLAAPARILGYGEEEGAGARLFASIERGLGASASAIGELLGL